MGKEIPEGVNEQESGSWDKKNFPGSGDGRRLENARHIRAQREGWVGWSKKSEREKGGGTALLRRPDEDFGFSRSAMEVPGVSEDTNAVMGLWKGSLWMLWRMMGGSVSGFSGETEPLGFMLRDCKGLAYTIWW